MADIATKTPVSLLQEYLSRRGITPTYQIIHSKGPFRYYIYFYYKAETFDAVGNTGRSKKEAKHLAAKALLDKLKSIDPVFDVNDNYSNSTTVKSTGITNPGAFRKDQNSDHNHEEKVMGNLSPNQDIYIGFLRKKEEKYMNIGNSGIVKPNGDSKSIESQKDKYSDLDHKKVVTSNHGENSGNVTTKGNTNTGTLRKGEHFEHHNFKEKVTVNPSENSGNIASNVNIKSSSPVHKIMDNSRDALRKDGYDIHKYKENITVNISGFFRNMTTNGDNYTGAFRNNGCDGQKFEEENLNKLLENLGIVKSNTDTCTDAFRKVGCDIHKYEGKVTDWKSLGNRSNVKANSDAKTIEPRKEEITTKNPSDNFRNVTSKGDSNTDTLQKDKYSVHYYEEEVTGHPTDVLQRNGYDIQKYKEKITGNPSGGIWNITSNGKTYIDALQKGRYDFDKYKENVMDNPLSKLKNVKLNDDAKTIALRKDDYSRLIYEENFMNNPVGLLQEMCIARHWPLPIYETKNVIIQSTRRPFAISCTLLEYTKVGKGKNKKVAKRLAAQNMLTTLQENLF